MAAETEAKLEELDYSPAQTRNRSDHGSPGAIPKATTSTSRSGGRGSPISAKRRCVSTACIACRKRKSKCDGNIPSCAACSSVYGTECIYDPNSDHRRKGVYKKDIDSLKTRNSTLQTLVQAILNYPENEVPDLVKQIRTCESLDDVAESIIARDNALGDEEDGRDGPLNDNGTPSGVPKFERELSGKMGKLRLENGSVSIIGGTSNLIFIGSGTDGEDGTLSASDSDQYSMEEDPVTSWSEVTSDPRLTMHLMSMYFTWHYTYFTTLSKTLFWRDFKLGKPSRDTKRKTEYCTPLLVNAILALGCHFTSWPAARADPDYSATAGDHFFKEAKRLILENDEHENPRLATVQALALMSVREAGCGREARGWVYSGISFRMACDLGLNIDSGSNSLDDAEIDARRITIWGCFLFDKCWSNYLGRQPQLPLSNIAVPKFDVFPTEDAEIWRPYTDAGTGQAHAQPSRTRTIALQTSQLCEISSDLLLYFYHPHQLEKPLSKQAELKKLSELHTRLEAWRKNLPKELEPKEGQLPNVLVMHMFFQLLFIHLFRPFLKYKQATSPLPNHVSPRKFLTQAAATISKLLRLYRRMYGLRQICNIVVYISHAACTVHLLNLPDKTAAKDIVHGLTHLEEIAESWLCARRTIGILHLVAKRWSIELPEAAQEAFMRAEAKFGPFKSHEHEISPKSEHQMAPPTTMQPLPPSVTDPNPETGTIPMDDLANPGFFPDAVPLASPMRTSLDGSLKLSQQAVANYNEPYRQQRYVVPQAQQDSWNQASTSQAPPARLGSITSPTISTLFNGVDGLMHDQEWWLRDSNQIFATWNGMDQQDTDLLANTGFHNNNNKNNNNNSGTKNVAGGYDNNGAYGYRSANGQM